MVACYIGPLAAYVIFRNKSLPAEKRILTPDHIRHVIAERGKRFGIKKSAEPKTSKREGPPVNFTAQGGQDRPRQRRGPAAGPAVARVSSGSPIDRRRASNIGPKAFALDFAEQGVAVALANRRRLAQPSAPRPSRGRRDARRVENLGSAERQRTPAKSRKEPSGPNSRARSMPARSRARERPAGERVIVQAAVPATRKWTFEELGMRTKVEEQLRAVIAQPRGPRALLGAARGRTQHARSTRPFGRSTGSCATWLWSKTRPIASARSTTPP